MNIFREINVFFYLLYGQLDEFSVNSSTIVFLLYSQFHEISIKSVNYLLFTRIFREINDFFLLFLNIQFHEFFVISSMIFFPSLCSQFHEFFVNSVNSSIIFPHFLQLISWIFYQFNDFASFCTYTQLHEFSASQIYFFFFCSAK